MGKRMLNCVASDFKKMRGNALKKAIEAVEGRTVCCETVCVRPTFLNELSNAEIAKAFGADMVLLNGFDCFDPLIFGAEESENPVQRVKDLSGLPIGANLEPVDEHAEMLESRIEIAPGRKCTAETVSRAEKLGLDFICLTGNPGTGVTNEAIEKCISMAKSHFTGIVIAGKMHGAGSKEPVMNEEIAKRFIQAGADVLLVPAVGTVPGFTDEKLVNIVKVAHANDALVLSAIGTSQEGSSKEVIEQIAIRNKVAGVDIQHIGDAGYGGLATVENIYAMSVAIRGVRHTVARMARSVIR